MKRALLAIALVAAPLFADEIHLKGGGRLTGVISEQTEESVTIDIGAGTMTVPMSTVVGIDKETVSPLEEYRAKAATVAADDIEGWRNLGRWATQYGLSAQADEAYTRVHNAYPNDEEANGALGLVLYNGKWVTEEESYLAQGYVRLGNDWMTPAERNAIKREEDARLEANRQEVAAVVEASETERKAAEAEEARLEEEEKRRSQLPTLGDSLWGYGYVPTVW